MKLHFEVSSCVRAASKFSTCTKCVDVCPDSIQLLDNLPTFQNATGVEAAAAIGICPTESFSLSDFSVTEFFFTFLESKIRLISPKINVPCISVLSVEHLVSLALNSEEIITLDLSAYDVESELFRHIKNQVEESNFILSNISSKKIETNSDIDIVANEVEDQNEVNDNETSRRSFLGNASLKGIVKHKMSFDEAVEAEELKAFKLDAITVAKIKTKNIPDKRKILLTSLKRVDKPEIYELLAQEDVTFVSQKYIDDSCNNCQICYRICPSGALTSNNKFEVINFDSMLCLKCHLCHDVCDPNSIHIQKGFELKEFFEPKQRLLAKFDVKRCNECGNNFTYTGGEQICSRCLIEEEEAMTLYNNANKMRGEG